MRGSVVSSQAAVGFPVAFGRLLDDVVRQGGSGRRPVPILLREEPVAHELLVEVRLRLARRVALRVPESAGVGREDFVDEDDLAVAVAA